MATDTELPDQAKLNTWADGQGFQYRYSFSSTATYNPNDKIMRIDKASVEAYALAPEVLLIEFGVEFASLDLDDVVLVGDNEHEVESISNDDRYVRLAGGVTLFTEDNFSEVGSEGGYVHIKMGKRFITYKVMGSDLTSVSLKKVKAMDSEVSTSPSAPRGSSARTR